MINFRILCPGCNRLSLVNLLTPCSNILNDGRVCEYALTTDVASGNSLCRRKENKHTNPPASGFTGEHSWTNSGLYDGHQTAAFASGNLCFDPVKDYFCLSFPISSGEARIAYQRHVRGRLVPQHAAELALAGPAPALPRKRVGPRSHRER